MKGRAADSTSTDADGLQGTGRFIESFRHEDYILWATDSCLSILQPLRLTPDGTSARAMYVIYSFLLLSKKSTGISHGKLEAQGLLAHQIGDGVVSQQPGQESKHTTSFLKRDRAI
jgi:hypothetical protein